MVQEIRTDSSLVEADTMAFTLERLTVLRLENGQNISTRFRSIMIQKFTVGSRFAKKKCPSQALPHKIFSSGNAKWQIQPRSLPNLGFCSFFRRDVLKVKSEKTKIAGPKSEQPKMAQPGLRKTSVSSF